MQLNSSTKIIFFENSSIGAETVQAESKYRNTHFYIKLWITENIFRNWSLVSFDGKLGVLESDFGMTWCYLFSPLLLNGGNYEAHSHWYITQ